MSKTSAPPGPAKAPCKSCPYRQNVPAGIWHPSEYAKLPAYDGEIIDQIQNGASGLFLCHQENGCLCSGWIATHGAHNLAALRLNTVNPSTWDYQSPVPVFASGEEAARHGMSGVQCPDARARSAIDRLARKKARTKREIHA